MSHPFYYLLKPLVPRALRMWLRRRQAQKILKTCGDIWPINEAAGKQPDNWPGWPDGKQFAFVLTHDVESQKGLDQVRQLAELEMELGFRSCFNFIPEGEYSVPPELLEWLVENGFEVGVHDLHHDGHLYSSRRRFRKKAKRINQYLKEWGAVGFRSGFMLRELDWLHDLNIQYDSSTFDTDPFEPQPDGVNTIFPMRIEGAIVNLESPHNGNKNDITLEHQAHQPLNEDPQSAIRNPQSHSRSAYVELPYTLPQDSTLFLVLGQDRIDTWKRKLDWIAECGGMALVNVHPDYLCFNQSIESHAFLAKLYAEFLNYAKLKYGSCCWHAQPRDVASYVNAHHSVIPDQVVVNGEKKNSAQAKKKIWIDLENTPHIPFFNPIIKKLKERGYEVVLTARDAYQTCEMADLYKFDYKRIGHHYGKHKYMKVWGLLVRSLQLIPFAWSERPHLSLNHGSRTQSLTSQMFGIPTITIMDYEHTSSLSATRKQWWITPELVRSTCSRSRHYAGIKEDVYVPDFKPDPSLPRQLRLEDADVVVTVRPPATEAHYHNPEAEILFTHFMERACAIPGVKSILLPRNKRQEDEIRFNHPHWFSDSKTVIPEGVVDGLNLLWHSDLVVSGGGTMNREAAAMGIPVYSIFRGTPGAVDRQLQKEGRLTMIANNDDVDNKIHIRTRSNRGSPADFELRQALKDILRHIEEILDFHYSAQSA